MSFEIVEFRRLPDDICFQSPVCVAGVQQEGRIAPLHPALTAVSPRKGRRQLGRLVELTQAVASERPVESATDDMAVPILNGNVEGSLQWKEQLSRPEADSNFCKPCLHAYLF